MYSVNDDGRLAHRVPPFGYLRVKAFFQLTEAFRRYRVLHRLLMPRHPPATLNSLTKNIFSTRYLMSYLLSLGLMLRRLKSTLQKSNRLLFLVCVKLILKRRFLISDTYINENVFTHFIFSLLI